MITTRLLKVVAFQRTTFFGPRCESQPWTIFNTNITREILVYYATTRLPQTESFDIKSNHPKR
jgi:hypothetical protein